MNVLFITRKFPPSTGGMENFARDLYVSLNNKLHVKLIKWGGSNRYLPIVLPYFLVRGFGCLLFNNVDIVHSQDVVVAPIGYLLSRIFHKPHAVVVHGLDITYRNKILQSINVRCVCKADVVFCISNAAADEAIKRGVSKTKIRVVPLGITDDKRIPRTVARKSLNLLLHINDDVPVILTVGRLVERKGVAWFVESVMPTVIDSYPQVVYAIIGDGADRERIEAIINNKGLAPNVRTLGRVDDKKMSAFYNGADVFVQPNIIVPGDIEGFGRVLLEASLCELPIVATGVEGIKDAIADGKNGVLIGRPKDQESFMLELGKFIDDKKYRRKFGRSSREYTLKHYQWSAISDDYVDSYKKVIRSIAI